MEVIENFPFFVAEARLATVLKEHRERKNRQIDTSDAKITFAQAAASTGVGLTQTSAAGAHPLFLEVVMATLLMSWPDLAKMEVRHKPCGF